MNRISACLNNRSGELRMIRPTVTTYNVANNER